MIRAEEWMDIRKLVQDGVPISRIAEMLGRDWKTVAKAASAVHQPAYQRGVRARNWILDAASYDAVGMFNGSFEYFGGIAREILRQTFSERGVCWSQGANLNPLQAGATGSFSSQY